MKDKPIGVFDSGIGGLSVLSQLTRFMPNEKYIYLGDTARVPYGNKSVETVKQYAEECTNFLLKKEVKLIVVACNTVSSLALDSVKKLARDIPVIGMISPASTAALRTTINKNIGVIGTRATIGSNSYADRIHKLSNEDVNVFSQACPLFVPIVEEGMIKHPASKLIAKEYLNPLLEKNIDTLVLGCTHYPLLKNLFTEIIPDIELIDSGEHASVSALRMLAENDALKEESPKFNKKSDIEFYVTDLPILFHDNAIRFLGYDVDKPIRLNSLV